MHIVDMFLLRVVWSGFAVIKITRYSLCTSQKYVFNSNLWNIQVNAHLN